ncbi:probable acetyltransferase TAP2 [Salvia hispanica]|uniref:probable acetyltransferase TAP2 n=1 Tax=Salvia hispanica TaxID=49212 RepID=UPI002009C90A|nr:probable acetyltransferase TAP2 [Salvia hispanica]
MAVAAAVQVGNLPSKFQRPKIAARMKANSAPLFVSTNPSDVNLHQLRELYAVCDHSCHRFPNTDGAGSVEPVDALKLSTALSHSSVVVSVFTNAESVASVGGNWIRKLTPKNGRLIGFGRAVSDLVLTATIYDVMVHPYYRGKGIGRTIVKKIIRMLINRDIYDIAALCNDNERLFFRACGFGDDMLGATTMMYTAAAASEEEDMIVAGRKLLLLPPQRQFKHK